MGSVVVLARLLFSQLLSFPRPSSFGFVLPGREGGLVAVLGRFTVAWESFTIGGHESS